MKQVEIDAKIKQAFTNVTPDVLASVLSECKEQKSRVITMTEKKRITPWAGRISSAAAAFVIVAGLLAGFHAYKVNYSVASIISLDVNPSIEIKVNKNEKVLEVNPLNDDGRIVVGEMDLEGNSIDVTVNALIGSMLREGYISELSNSILISVENSDPAKGTELLTKLTKEVNALLQTKTFSGAVLSQTISQNTDLLNLAKSYGITIGKAQLIQQISQQDARYTFDKLALLSINELNLLRETGYIQLSNVTTVGTASDKAYIGEVKAKEIALSHAGVSASYISKYSVEIEYENGIIVYDIEFYVDAIEYGYDINAINGEVVFFEKEWDENKDTLEDDDENEPDDDHEEVDDNDDKNELDDDDEEVDDNDDENEPDDDDEEVDDNADENEPDDDEEVDDNDDVNDMDD